MKKMSLWLMVLILCVVLAGSYAIAGCRAEAPLGEEAAEEPAEEEVEEPAELVFGNIPVAMSDEWNGYSVENFRYAAEKKGVEVIALDSEWDGEKALRNLEDLITSQVDNIGVFVYTPEAAQDFINRANEAGIPISFENTKLVDKVEGDYIFNVACDYREIGYEAAKFISENYPDTKLFYARGLPGMGIVEEYQIGIDEGLEEFGTVELAASRDTNWDTETAFDATQDVIAAGIEFDVIFANNESMAVGCHGALDDAGMAGEIPIVTTGGGPTGVQMLKDGIVDATISSPVSLQGLWLFKAMWLYSAYGIEPPEKYIPLPTIPATLDNIDDIISWEPSDDLIDYIGGLDKW
jgi:ribose transport system substrate-binding protein